MNIINICTLKHYYVKNEEMKFKKVDKIISTHPDGRQDKTPVDMIAGLRMNFNETDLKQ